MFEQAFKNIDDVLWKDAGCTSELDYTEQTSWLLFPTRTRDQVLFHASQVTAPGHHRQRFQLDA